MDFQISVTDIEHVIIDSGLRDQGGNLYPELPVGATLVCTSSNPASCNPLPMPGGVSFESDSVDLGVSTITVTPGGILDPTDPRWAPRTGEVTVTASAPAGFQLSARSVAEVPPEPPAPPTP
jgi:hypothetical protein